MNGDQIQDLIYDWLGKFYPDGPGWHDPGFDCFGNTPIEIKMISAFDAIEYNIGNGGWAQLLWNCFGQWRRLIEIAKEGYQLIGALEQSAALDKLYALCERDERECEEAILQESNRDDESEFGDFTSRSYGRLDGETEWEALFFDDSGVYEKRLAWLVANEGRIRNLVGALHG